MTLSQWIERWEICVSTHPNGCRYVPENEVSALTMRQQLYHLSDYAVSSLTGGTFWLVRRIVAE